MEIDSDLIYEIVLWYYNYNFSNNGETVYDIEIIDIEKIDKINVIFNAINVLTKVKKSDRIDIEMPQYLNLLRQRKLKLIGL